MSEHPGDNVELLRCADEAVTYAERMAAEVLAAWNNGWLTNGHLIHRSNEVVNITRHVRKLLDDSGRRPDDG